MDRWDNMAIEFLNAYRDKIGEKETSDVGSKGENKYKKALQIAGEDMFRIRVLYAEARGDYRLADHLRKIKDKWIAHKIEVWLERIS